MWWRTYLTCSGSPLAVFQAHRKFWRRPWNRWQHNSEDYLTVYGQQMQLMGFGQKLHSVDLHIRTPGTAPGPYKVLALTWTLSRTNDSQDNKRTCSWLNTVSTSSNLTPFSTRRQCWICKVISPFTKPHLRWRRQSYVSITFPYIVFSWGTTPICTVSWIAFKISEHVVSCDVETGQTCFHTRNRPQLFIRHRFTKNLICSLWAI